MTSKIYILDTSAILNEALPNEESYTVKEVFDELKTTIKHLEAQNLLSQGKIKIEEPDMESLENTLKTASKLGFMLSSTDISVISLALSLKSKNIDTITITDDYAMQNLLKELGLEYEGAQFSGITEQKKMVFKCRGCSKEYLENTKDCKECGAPLFKKVKKE